jgi:hypothetical protein
MATQRRKRIIPEIAQKMSGEVRRVSLLTQAMHEMRMALDRLSREVFICLAILICLWHVLSDFFSRLLATWWP